MKYISTPSMLTVISNDGQNRIGVARADISYESVRQYVVDEQGQDFDHIAELFGQAKAEISEAISMVESAVDGNAGESYRVTHGDPVSDVVFDTAQRLRLEGNSPKVLGRFAARLMKNPSASARSQLFAWLAAEGFTLTKDGLIVGYKGVTEDYRSVHSGREQVSVVAQDGTTEIHQGHIPYPVGSTVTMERRLVNDDRNQGCSVGLHVGTYHYASGWGHTVLLVLVDPADVVSIPKDCNNHKMRVTKLVVAAEAVDGKVPDAVMTLADPQAEKKYRDDPENELPEPEYDDEDDEDSEYDEYDDEDEDEGGEDTSRSYF